MGRADSGPESGLGVAPMQTIMQTISFYSFKGGTGRSLALSNLARFLSGLGQSVVALDFDLEAPGLHYKFGLGSPRDSAPRIRQGFVDYVHAFYMHEYLGIGESPTEISSYAVELEPAGDSEAPIRLIPAGSSPDRSYWTKLAQIDWHSLLRTPPELPRGPLFFLETKERIREELQPDFLLVDARTGITEMGGVAAAMLADTVVCLLLSNEETLDGSREVLRSLSRTLRPPGAAPLKIVPVLSRVPTAKDLAGFGALPPEPERTEQVRDFLNELAPLLEETLSVPDVLVLHSQPDLQVRERLLVGSGASAADSRLLADYLRLAGGIAPPDIAASWAQQIIDQAWALVRTDPGAAGDLLTSLAEFVPAAAYPELLRLQTVRNAGTDALLRTALEWWRATGDQSPEAMWDVVADAMKQDPEMLKDAEKAEFAVAVWRGAGHSDPKFAQHFGPCLSESAPPTLRADVLLGYIEGGIASDKAVGMCVANLALSGRKREARELIDRFRAAPLDGATFVRDWAIATLDHSIALDLMDELVVAANDSLAGTFPLVAARVLARAGDKGAAVALVARALAGPDSPGVAQLVEVGREMASAGWLEAFRAALSGHPLAAQVLNVVDTPPSG